MITFDHVSLETAAGLILNDLTLTIEPHECVCIAGSGGSGKTLFLRMLMGEERPTSGAVTVDGFSLHALPPKLLRHYRREIGVVREDEQLLPDRSIASNIALPLEMRRMPKGKIAKRVSELLAQIGLLERASALPQELHFSERRKVAFAQALAHRPTILIADEPVADLDRGSARIILSLLRELHASGSTILLATRNPQSLAALKPRTVRLESGTIVGDGARIASAPAAVPRLPVTPAAV